MSGLVQLPLQLLVLSDVEDRTNYRTYQRELAVVVGSILVLSIVTIVITTLEPLSEIIAIFVHIDVIAVISVSSILIAVGILIVIIPSVGPISLARTVALLVT